MNEQQFQRVMRRAHTMATVESADWKQACYWEGYQRGLRRNYYGEKFGTAAEHKAWMGLAGSRDEQRQQRGRGYRDGLVFAPGKPGRPTDEKKQARSVTLRPSVSEPVEAVAESEGVSFSEAVERLLVEALESRRST